MKRKKNIMSSAKRDIEETESMLDSYEDESTIKFWEAKQRELVTSELEALKRYTSGQWSDGIGEGFEQHPCKVIRGTEIYISPWYHNQKQYVIQEEIND